MVEAKPFCLFAECSVVYDGRASSLLEYGNYLIIYKQDGSVGIHGASMVMPCNYISSGASLSIDYHTCGRINTTLLFRHRRERVVVGIGHIYFINYLENWSLNKPVMQRTERELALKIFNNWFDYFDDDFEIIMMEAPTSLGPIDILGLTATTNYVVEVKRKHAGVAAVSQLLRYIEALQPPNRQYVGVLAAPGISKKAMEYLQSHGLRYLEIGFD